MGDFKAIFTLLGLYTCLLVVPFGSFAQDVPQLVLPIGHTDWVTSVAFSPDAAMSALALVTGPSSYGKSPLAGRCAHFLDIRLGLIQ